MKTNIRRRLLYLSWSVMPSKMANAVQVVRMANALAATQEVEVVLVARRAKGDDRTPIDIASQCGLDARVPLVLLSSNKFAAGLEILRLAVGDHGDKPFDCIYSRVLPVFLRRLAPQRRILELHEPPRANWRLKPMVFDRVVASGSVSDIVYISEGLERIVEREHARALARGAPGRLVLHSGGASPISLDPPSDNQPFTVAYAGRLDKLDKAVVECLARSHPDIMLNVYGNMNAIPAWLEDCPIVRLHGWVSANDLVGKLAEAHVLIAPYPDMPATAWISPVKIFDYAAAGRPILVSDTAAVRDIFPDGEIGWILSAEDHDAWGEAITRLQADKGMRLEMSRSALEFAARFDFAKRAQCILSLMK